VGGMAAAAGMAADGMADGAAGTATVMVMDGAAAW
jgi:hypothetical protein